MVSLEVSVVPGGIYAADHPDGHTQGSSVRWGSLACESKFQGEIDEYDCSNYQLFKLCF